jgi:hydrogenase nickel incorporation protein HypA/HybF
MHELSIAMSIVAAVQEESERVGGARAVEAVHLRLGALSGVVEDALVFSYSLATADTALEGSKLVIEDVPITVLCPACDAERPVVSMQQMCCAACGTPSAEVVHGRELLVTGLEMRS